jgi:hypothetical protein
MTKRRRIMLKWALALIAVAAIVGLATGVVEPRLFWRIPWAAVRINGAVSGSSRLYASLDGRFLVIVPDEGFPDTYVVYRYFYPAAGPAVGDVGGPRGDVRTMGYCVIVLAPDSSIPHEAMPGVEDLFDPKLRIEFRRIDFYDTTDRQIDVKW